MLTALLASLVLSADAPPPRRLCVLDAIDGSGQANRAQVISLLEVALSARGPLVTNKQLQQAAGARRIQRNSWSNPAQLKVLGKAAGCDVAVTARVARSFGSWSISLAAVDVASGDALTEVMQLLGRPHMTAERARSLAESLLSALGSVSPPPPVAVDPVDPVTPAAAPEPDPWAAAGAGFSASVESSLKLETTVEVGGRVVFEHFGFFDQSLERKVTGRDNLEAAVRLKAVHPRVSAFASVLVRQDFTDTVRNRIEVEEAWVELTIPNVSLKAGRLITTWGSTTLYSPTDLLNPFDLRDPLRTEKWGTLMLRGAATLGPVVVELSYLPLPEFHRLPVVEAISPGGTFLGSSRWLNGGIDVPDAIPVRFEVGPMQSFPARPSTSQLAARVELAVARADVGVGVAWMLDRFPSILVTAVPTPGVPTDATVYAQFVPRRLLVVTADAERAFGALRVAAEGAAFFTADPLAKNPDVIDPYIVGDVGADYRTGEFFGDQRLHFFLEFAAARALRGALTLDGFDRLRYPFPLSVLGRVAWEVGPSLRLELTGTSSLQRVDFALTPRVEYLLFDRAKVQLGVDLLFGDPQQGFFGPYRRNSRFLATVEARF